VLGLWCLTPLSTKFQFYSGGGNRSTRRKPDKLYHIDLDKTETAHVMKHVKGNKVV